jgi:hypothetical protein
MRKGSPPSLEGRGLSKFRGLLTRYHCSSFFPYTISVFGVQELLEDTVVVSLRPLIDNYVYKMWLIDMH